MTNMCAREWHDNNYEQCDADGRFYFNNNQKRERRRVTLRCAALRAGDEPRQASRVEYATYCVQHVRQHAACSSLTIQAVTTPFRTFDCDDLIGIVGFLFYKLKIYPDNPGIISVSDCELFLVLYCTAIFRCSIN